MAAKFGLFVDEDHSKLPTLYWSPKLRKRPYKSRFIANSSVLRYRMAGITESAMVAYTHKYAVV